MRSRSLALAAASVALSVFVASCGDDEPNATETPAPATSSPATSTPTASTPAASTPAPTSADATTPVGSTTPSEQTITQLLAGNPDLQSLKTAVGAAGLSGTLGQPGPYTVFAPNNDAFAKLGSKLDTLLQPASKDTLANILKFHVVSGEFRAKDLKDGQLLTTVQGTRLRVTIKGSTVSLGNSLGSAAVLSPDTDASNGVVHVIDSVLTPKK